MVWGVGELMYQVYETDYGAQVERTGSSSKRTGIHEC